MIKCWDEDARVRRKQQIRPMHSGGKKFFRIPTDKQPQELTLNECLSIAGFRNEGEKPKAASAKLKSKTKSRKLRSEGWLSLCEAQSPFSKHFRNAAILFIQRLRPFLKAPAVKQASGAVTYPLFQGSPSSG